MIPLTIALAVLVGVTLGLLGGGGSILTVPLLVYVAGMETKAAIATSLLVVGATSAAGAIFHARAGRVQWRTGLIFGSAGLVGAYAGGRASHFVPAQILLIGLALMMVLTAAAMLRGRQEPDPDKVHAQLPVARVLLDGLVVGLVTGLVGAGGGFLVVPALALLGGLPMPVAVGTSLIVIAMKSLGGLAGYLADVQIDWAVAAAVTTAAVVGALLGGRLAGKVSPEHLRKGFGWFVLIMGTGIILQETPDDLLPVVAGGITVVAALGAAALMHRRTAASSDTKATRH